MLKLICSLFFIQLALCSPRVRRESVVDEGTHLLICKQEPLELGIVLDSSSSIRNADFLKGIEFLQGFLQQFEIGNGRNDARVSIITYGKGIYPADGFNLDTYDNKDEVIEAIGNVPHRAGPHTDTGAAVKYMHTVQMASARPYAEKISIVITDGNSQNWRLTANESASARDDGINMFVIGVGHSLRDAELIRIAGDPERVTKVDNYDKLDEIKETLAHKTCIRKEKPTTTPPPKASCGEANPADINFVFSPAELGLDATAWTTSMMNTVISHDEMKDGFRYGVVSGSCPDDEGFALNRYTNPDDIRERLSKYEKSRMPALVTRVLESGFSEEKGGRVDARDVVVLVATSKAKGLEKEVARLVDQGVDVFIADPSGTGIDVPGAFTIPGRSSRLAAVTLVTRLCELRTGEPYIVN